MIMSLKGNDIVLELYENKIRFIEKGIFFFPLSTTKIYEISVNNIMSIKINKASLMGEANIIFSLSGEDKTKESRINPVFFKKEHQEDYEKFITLIEEKIRKRKTYLFLLTGLDGALELHENFIVFKRKETIDSHITEEKTIVISDILSVQIKALTEGSGYLQISLYGGTTDTLEFSNISESIIAEKIKDYILSKKITDKNNTQTSNINDNAKGCFSLIAWIFIFFIVLGVFFSVMSYRNNNTDLTSSLTSVNQTSEIDKTLPLGQRQALQKAKSYLNTQAFSEKGLYKQLIFEGFSEEDSNYAVKSIPIDWNEQAAKKAKNYLESQSFSRQGLLDQLIYEGFSESQANYGVEQAGY